MPIRFNNTPSMAVEVSAPYDTPIDDSAASVDNLAAGSKKPGQIEKTLQPVVIMQTPGQWFPLIASITAGESHTFTFDSSPTYLIISSPDGSIGFEFGGNVGSNYLTCLPGQVRRVRWLGNLTVKNLGSSTCRVEVMAHDDPACF